VVVGSPVIPRISPARLSRLGYTCRHSPNVTVRDFFTANGTGYLAMSYLDGITLKDYVARKGGR